MAPWVRVAIQSIVYMVQRLCLQRISKELIRALQQPSFSSKFHTEQIYVRKTLTETM